MVNCVHGKDICVSSDVCQRQPCRDRFVRRGRLRELRLSFFSPKVDTQTRRTLISVVFQAYSPEIASGGPVEEGKAWGNCPSPLNLRGNAGLTTASHITPAHSQGIFSARSSKNSYGWLRRHVVVNKPSLRRGLFLSDFTISTLGQSKQEKASV